MSVHCTRHKHTCILKRFEASEPMGLKVDIATKTPQLRFLISLIIITILLEWSVHSLLIFPISLTFKIHWRVKQPSKLACFVNDLRCWGAWDTSCVLKGKDIIPSTACKREVWKEEALDDLSWKSERGPSSIRRTLQLLQRWHWGHFWEMGWSVYGLFWLRRYHLNLNWTAEWSSLTRRARRQIPWAL